MTTKDVLSEGEIEALMESVSEGEVPRGDDGRGISCETFDFSTREQALLAQMPALKTLNEKHSLALAQSILGAYKLNAHVEVADIALVKLDQVLQEIPDPSGINIVTLAPLNGVSFVVFPGQLLSFVVDNFFGGTPGISNVASTRKNLTPTERRINDVLAAGFLATLKEAWSEVVSLNPAPSSFEINADFLQASSPDELALSFPFAVKIGEWESVINWIVPYSSIEPLRPKLGSPGLEQKPQPSNSNWEAHFRWQLQAVELEVSGSFTSRDVSIAEVLRLKPGSIVPLKMPTEVNVYVENTPFLLGEHGALNGNKSIKITEMMPHAAKT
ncbi:MAG: flagellar motor switch protein FliM [Halioglobus sp.]|jgi:flagellar motor switch protein FliM